MVDCISYQGIWRNVEIEQEDPYGVIWVTKYPVLVGEVCWRHRTYICGETDCKRCKERISEQEGKSELPQAG